MGRLAEADANSDAANPSAGVDESYNDFWLEGASIGDTVRTSHIVYPKNGRIPDLQEGVTSQIGTRGSEATGEPRPARVLARGIGADGPEVGPNTVDYEFTVNDPSTYTDKFTGVVSMTKVAGLMYEYACHEGNYGMTNILRGARMQENLGTSER